MRGKIIDGAMTGMWNRDRWGHIHRLEWKEGSKGVCRPRKESKKGGGDGGGRGV